MVSIFWRHFNDRNRNLIAGVSAQQPRKWFAALDLEPETLLAHCFQSIAGGSIFQDGHGFLNNAAALASISVVIIMCVNPPIAGFLPFGAVVQRAKMMKPALPVCIVMHSFGWRPRPSCRGRCKDVEARNTADLKTRAAY